MNKNEKYLVIFLAAIFVLVALRVAMPNFLSSGNEKFVLTVGSVSLSAKTITLKYPIKGFGVIAVLPETEIVFSDGETATLKDLISGERIQAVGRSGDGGALLAKKIVIFRFR